MTRTKYCFLALVFIVFLSACKQKMQADKSTYYTCSMHPQIHENHAGNCPICGMRLNKVTITSSAYHAVNNKIILTAQQIQLAGIQTDTIRNENTGNDNSLNGKVTVDENHTDQMSAKISGRIENLFVRTIGEKVFKGKPIYTIYSEDLLEAEKEYLLAIQQKKILNNPDINYNELLNAAKSKLLLWGMTSSQVTNLKNSGKFSQSVTVLSNISGTVSDIAVHEGDYVTEGMPILKTQDLKNLWIEAQVYASESKYYKVSDLVTISFPDLTEHEFSGRIGFINPEISVSSKVVLLRINIQNLQGLIQPGMLAYISLKNGKHRSLAVPASAVLSAENGSKVWVKNKDDSFSPKMITIEAGNQNYIPVVKGLVPGDIVVTRGAYLLNSEAIFKTGTDQMGMKM